MSLTCRLHTLREAAAQRCVQGVTSKLDGGKEEKVRRVTPPWNLQRAWRISAVSSSSVLFLQGQGCEVPFNWCTGNGWFCFLCKKPKTEISQTKSRGDQWAVCLLAFRKCVAGQDKAFDSIRLCYSLWMLLAGISRIRNVSSLALEIQWK